MSRRVDHTLGRGTRQIVDSSRSTEDLMRDAVYYLPLLKALQSSDAEATPRGAGRVVRGDARLCISRARDQADERSLIS